MSSEELRVAYIEPADVRPYRLAFLERLNAQDDLRVSAYGGRAKAGMGGAQSSDLPVEFHLVRNVFWPFGGHRTIAQIGLLSVLKGPVNVIIMPEVTYNMSLWGIRLLHRTFRKRLVLMGFFYREGRQSTPGKIKEMVRRFFIASADAFVAYGERGRAELLRTGKCEKRVFVSHNTLDVARLKEIAGATTAGERDWAREVTGSHGQPLLLYIGRLLPVKRVDVLVEAIAAWPTDRPPAVAIVGDGPDRGRLEGLAAGSPIRFLGAEYDEAVLARYLSVADVLVLPGRVGLTPVHGFAHDVPCVTTAAASVAQSPEYDYIIDSVNGIVLGKPDPDVYATELARLLEDHERLARLRLGASQTAMTLGMERMVDAFADAIRTAVKP